MAENVFLYYDPLRFGIMKEIKRLDEHSYLMETHSDYKKCIELLSDFRKMKNEFLERNIKTEDLESLVMGTDYTLDLIEKYVSRDRKLNANHEKYNVTIVEEIKGYRKTNEMFRQRWYEYENLVKRMIDQEKFDQSRLQYVLEMSLFMKMQRENMTEENQDKGKKNRERLEKNVATLHENLKYQLESLQYFINTIKMKVETYPPYSPEHCAFFTSVHEFTKRFLHDQKRNRDFVL